MASLRTLESLLMSTRARAGAGASQLESKDSVNGRNGHLNGRNGHHDDWSELRVEIARSRRFGRPFGLIRIEGKTRLSLGAGLRSIDRAWTVDGVTYLLLPETDREAAQSLCGRLLREASGALAGCSLTVASFPEDGLTSGALLKALRPARTDWAHAPESRPAFVPVADSPVAHA
jgi:hypothetical protein